jgi:hypothetical protein
MKYLLPTIAAISTTIFTGCAGINQNSVAGNRVSDPFVPGQLSAHLVPSDKHVTASGSVETYQILGITWNAGGQETYIGNVGNRLPLKSKMQINPVQMLVGSPADKEAAIDAAYYKALESIKADALVSTKVKVHTEGYSILGIYGHGTATATIDALGAKVVSGSLPYGTVIPTDNRMSGLFGNLFGNVPLVSPILNLFGGYLGLN